MIRKLTLSTIALAAMTAAPPAFAGGTTRIETRPFYGATVTLEHGVRVIRPLPADENVIINPGGRTPVSLGFSETNVYERRVVKNYNYGSADAGYAVYGGRAGFPYIPHYSRANHGHRTGGHGVGAH